MENITRRTNRLCYVIASISALFSIACNNTPTYITEPKGDLLVKDTTISKTSLAKLNEQIIDYFSISKQADFKKFKKYTVSFFCSCAIKSYPETKDTISQKDLLSSIFKQTIAGKSDLKRKFEKLKTEMRYEIKEPIRVFVVDTTLFANVDLNSYYIFKNKRREIITNMVSISEDHGKNWQFLDKDGCRELLECQFDKRVADAIMLK